MKKKSILDLSLGDHAEYCCISFRLNTNLSKMVLFG